jgi:hypothetical protein
VLYCTGAVTAGLQIEKSKEPSSGPAKQKHRPAKGKSIPVKPSSCCYKGYIANNNLSDTDTESSDSNSSDSDKEEVVEVAACSQDLGKVTLSQ